MPDAAAGTKAMFRQPLHKRKEKGRTMEKELSRPYILFGGDYNPDQWDTLTLQKDMELFRKAGINTVTLPVFTWAKMEPKEGEYHFEWLDPILDLLEENGISYFLSTPTSAQPAWMSAKYPEVLPVDVAGRKRTHGMRVFFCINSPAYRTRAAAIAEAMAVRYKDRRGLIGWHVANEYGTFCYCENCQRKFRLWLQKRYGTIEMLNERWHTCFWGRTVYSFDEIMLPTELNDDYRFSPAVQLDYLRFVTDSTAECFENEARILKKFRPDLPVFTNISGHIKKLNQFEMVRHMDCAAWDNYPAPADPPSLTAMKHDLMRGAMNGGSYYVMEQSPNQQNWQPYNKLKRPGELRRLCYQGLAHGSDSCLYFQMRQSIAGQEKFHGAVISRSGDGNTRIFREFTSLGGELARLGDAFIGARIQAGVGILFDWENWWALELTSGPSKDMDYLGEVHRYYQAFYRRNIPIDFLKMDSDLSGYRLIVAPMLYMMKGDIAERLKQFVRNGGTLIATYMTGYVDENDRCIYGAYPGPLREVLGLWVEETDALYPGETNRVRFLPGTEFPFGAEDAPEVQDASCSFLSDLVRTETAQTLAVYEEDFYAGRPAVTVNAFGSGRAYYLATRLSGESLSAVISAVAAQCALSEVFPFDGELEVTRRDGEKGSTWFVINHSGNPGNVGLGEDVYVNLLNGRTLTGNCQVPAGEVLVLTRRAPA